MECIIAPTNSSKAYKKAFVKFTDLINTKVKVAGQFTKSLFPSNKQSQYKIISRFRN